MADFRCLVATWAVMILVFWMMKNQNDNTKQRQAAVAEAACLRAQGLASAIEFVPYQLRAADLSAVAPFINSKWRVNVSTGYLAIGGEMAMGVVHAYVHVHVHASNSACPDPLAYICRTRACMHTCIYMCVRACLHAYTRMYAYVIRMYTRRSKR